MLMKCYYYKELGDDQNFQDSRVQAEKMIADQKDFTKELYDAVLQ